MTYYVPFAAAVLLLSLGSDYNVFVVGRIWQTARERPLREAIVEEAPRASSTITTAGLTLGGSFALLALIPLRPMRELALALAGGILLDTFVVRSLLVPSLLALFRRGQGRRATVRHRLGDGERALHERRVRVAHVLVLALLQLHRPRRRRLLAADRRLLVDARARSGGSCGRSTCP